MIKLFNDLTRKKEYFRVKDGVVKFYSCGPTIYNYAHIGNMRSFSTEDLLVRLFKSKGYKVIHVRNLTDVEDKIIKSLNESGQSLKEYTDYYANAFFDDCHAMNFLNSDFYPRPTEYIDDIVDFVIDLEKTGYAYKGDDNSYYFKVNAFKDYGKLSGINVANLKSNASGRTKNDEYDKDNLSDFALWKAHDVNDGLVYWNTRLGKGRPGWHIECSVMANKLLGDTIDLHSGGEDLIFPHHENEVAQSEARTGKQFAKFWIHTSFLMVDGKKMSKSLKNFYTLRDLLNLGYNPLAIKMLFYTCHYRNQLNFTLDALKSIQKNLDDINITIERLTNYYSFVESDLVNLIEQAEQKYKAFIKALDDDLNSPKAITILNEYIKLVNGAITESVMSKRNAKKLLSYMKKYDAILGLFKFNESVNDTIVNYGIERNKFRQSKDFVNSDKMRNMIEQTGYKMDDLKNGFTFVKKT